MQVKLLRVIQEKTVRPVGEQLEVGIDVRFLSATHKNLAQLVAEGKFREDLFYRVNVIELRVPSLRERPEDVRELAEAILRRLGRRMKITPPMLGKDALSALAAYAFPGNVRELENILERAITLTYQRRNHRGRHTAEAASGRRGPRARPAVPPAPWAIIWKTLSATPSIKALEQTRYNKTAAAKVLGMSFRALRYRIKKLGIE